MMPGLHSSRQAPSSGGTGLLTGYAGPGILIGPGAGFPATALLPVRAATGPDSRMSVPAQRTPVLLVPGVFMIALGIGIVVAPKEIWVYIVPVFLILLGIGFLFRGIRAGS